MIGRLKRLEEINGPVEECVRAVCDLLSDAVAAGRNKKVLRAIGCSVRLLGTDLLVETLRKAVKIKSNPVLDVSVFPFSGYVTSTTQSVARPASGCRRRRFHNDWIQVVPTETPSPVGRSVVTFCC